MKLSRQIYWVGKLITHPEYKWMACDNVPSLRYDILAWRRKKDKFGGTRTVARITSLRYDQIHAWLQHPGYPDFQLVINNLIDPKTRFVAPWIQYLYIMMRKMEDEVSSRD